MDTPLGLGALLGVEGPGPGAHPRMGGKAALPRCPLSPWALWAFRGGGGANTLSPSWGVCLLPRCPLSLSGTMSTGRAQAMPCLTVLGA